MLKVSMLICRDQSRDEETWKKWLLEEHMPRGLPLALKHGVERIKLVRLQVTIQPKSPLAGLTCIYASGADLQFFGTQFLTPSNFKERYLEHVEVLRAESGVGWDVAPYDAEVILWTSDFQNIRNLFSDPDYEDKVRKFIEGWIDKTKLHVQVGTQTTFIKDGKIVKNMPKEWNQ